VRAAALALWPLLIFGAAVGLVMVHITCDPDPLFFPALNPGDEFIYK